MKPPWISQYGSSENSPKAGWRVQVTFCPVRVGAEGLRDALHRYRSVLAVRCPGQLRVDPVIGDEHVLRRRMGPRDLAGAQVDALGLVRPVGGDDHVGTEVRRVLARRPV